MNQQKLQERASNISSFGFENDVELLVVVITGVVLCTFRLIKTVKTKVDPWLR